MAVETHSQRIARLRREAGGINGPRTDDASPIKGYSRKQGAARNYSNLDAFYARQHGAPSSDNPAFEGLTPEEVAMEMKRRGETTSVGGKGIVPDTRLPQRPHSAPLIAPTSGNLSGPGYDVPILPTGGYAEPSTDSSTPVKDDPFGTGFMPMGGNNPFSPPPPSPATAAPTGMPRQTVGRIDPQNTPAALRQMAQDAATGRSISTAGATGLTPSTTPGGRPTQAADFRRMISSKYGTGTNASRVPGQGEATTVDLMGRQVPIRDFLRERKDIQRSKGQIAEGEDENVDTSEETQEAA